MRKIEQAEVQTASKQGVNSKKIARKQRKPKTEAQAQRLKAWMHRNHRIDPGNQTLDQTARIEGKWTGFGPVRFTGLYICKDTGLFHLQYSFLSLTPSLSH